LTVLSQIPSNQKPSRMMARSVLFYLKKTRWQCSSSNYFAN
jgi:hypothetical protein